MVPLRISLEKRNSSLSHKVWKCSSKEKRAAQSRKRIARRTERNTRKAQMTKSARTRYELLDALNPKPQTLNNRPICARKC